MAVTTRQPSLVHRKVLEANARYAAAFGDKGRLPLPPARRFAILTCMDARLGPAKIPGLAEGDAHGIRNAGGRASDDALRSLVISHKLLGTREWFVVHHTDCGMEGGFKWLSQRLDRGGCGDYSKSAFGSVRAGRAAVAGPAPRGAA